MAALSRRRPRTVVWELTAGCSFHCAHCYNVWTAPGAPSIRDVSTSEAVAIAHRLPPWLESVAITGGEPLVRSDVETIVVAIRETIDSVSIATNGLILTDRRAQSLALAGVTSVQITLLASEPKLHDALVGRDGAFDAVLRAIAAARHAGLTVVVFFVLLRANANMLPGVSKLAHAMGAAGVVLNRFQPGGRALQQTSSLTPTPNQIQNALASAKALRPVTEVVLGTIVPPCEGGPLLATITRCPLGTSKAYPTIGPDGGVRPCNHTPVVVGYALEEPLEALLVSDRMNARMPLPPECFGCRDREGCGGGCVAARAVADRPIYATPKTIPHRS